jgi:transcriptional regulator with XRE-family HTH domain
VARSEQYYIKFCRKQIEKKFSFGSGHGYTQRDLEILSQRIEEKTGVIISLSTLKRFWKNNFKQSPQIATLNALATLLEYRDWQDFKQSSQKKLSYSIPLIVGIVIGLSAIFITSYIIHGLKTTDRNEVKVTSPIVNGPIEFSAEKTVTSGIPNTVIFKYDVTHIVADSFFIAQSWNEFHKVQIDPAGNALSSIYYESGYHRARLIANDSIVAMQPIHILSEGWEPHIYYDEHQLIPIEFSGLNFISDGRLHLEKSLLEMKQVDTTRYFYSRISNSQQFNVSSDNFMLTTRMKVDKVNITSLCPWMILIIVTEKNIFRVAFQKKGCEKYASYKVGEIIRNGDDNDLSALGCDIYDWQELSVLVRNKNAEIHINGEPAFSETYKENYGDIMGLIYIFEGKGSIDFVRLEDEEGLVVFEDDFGSTHTKISMKSDG